MQPFETAGFMPANLCLAIDMGGSSSLDSDPP